MQHTKKPAKPSLHIFTATVAVLLLVCGHEARAQAPHYTITDLGSINGSISEEAYGVNNLGDLAGTYGNVQGFIYSHTTGTMTDVGSLGFSSTVFAYGINDSALVVGAAKFSTGRNHATVYSQGTLTDLGTFTGGTNSRALGINNAGIIVGDSTGSAFTTTGFADAFMTDSNRNLIDIGNLGGLNGSTAYSINSSNHVVGQSYTTNNLARQAFYYSSTGGMIDIGPATGTSAAQSINNSDVVAGWAAFATGTHAYVWSQAGGILDLGTLGGSTSMAWGINNFGVVVGQSRTTANALDGFVYLNGMMYDLNDVVDSGSGYTSICLGDSGTSFGNPINDAGQIAAHALIGGQEHALLLTPVAAPEPSSTALLLTATLFGSLRRRRVSRGK
jgi:probable HAF family extracellular repeat protein